MPAKAVAENAIVAGHLIRMHGLADHGRIRQNIVVSGWRMNTGREKQILTLAFELESCRIYTCRVVSSRKKD